MANGGRLTECKDYSHMHCQQLQGLNERNHKVFLTSALSCVDLGCVMINSCHQIKLGIKNLPVVCTPLFKFNLRRRPSQCKYNCTSSMWLNPGGSRNCCTNCIAQQTRHAGASIEIISVKGTIL